MKPLFQYLTFGGMAVLLLTAWTASQQGWGLSAITGRQKIEDRAVHRDCPDYQKDRFGNCPPRTHRTRLGARNFYDGRGK